MQARARQQIKRIMDQLMAIGKDFEAGSVQFNSIVGAIKNLNGAFKEPAAPETPKTPLPVPATAPGAGLGGAPPTGLPGPAGGPMGAGPVAPGME
jgi:hypothetical protein